MTDTDLRFYLGLAYVAALIGVCITLGVLGASWWLVAPAVLGLVLIAAIAAG